MKKGQQTAPEDGVSFVTDWRGVLHVVDHQRGDLTPDQQYQRDRMKDAELEDYYG